MNELLQHVFDPRWTGTLVAIQFRKSDHHNWRRDVRYEK